MSDVLVYYAHPGHKYSHANKAMCIQAKLIPDITFVDLYAEYPRFNIDIDIEQQRLLEHKTIVFQFPLFWYSTPALVKEWQDLVLEYGFAYGEGGNKLKGKNIMLAITAAGSAEAYSAEGLQRHSLRTYLTPLQQMATLCQMMFLPPYVLFSAIKAPKEGLLQQHSEGYRQLLTALRDNTYNFSDVSNSDFLTIENLPRMMMP